jgi:hypothetical protein
MAGQIKRDSIGWRSLYALRAGYANVYPSQRKIAHRSTQTVYQLKKSWFSGYLIEQLSCLSEILSALLSNLRNVGGVKVLCLKGINLMR